jgi:hypothetical protein
VIEFAVYEHHLEYRFPVASGKSDDVASLQRVWIARDNIDGEVLVQSRYLEPVLEVVRRYQSEVIVYLSSESER